MERNVASIKDLNTDYKGITLNEQDIDLMMIANASTRKDLENALKKITNISYKMTEEIINEEQFKNIRQEVFDLYMNSLTSRNDYYKEKDIQLAKKIEHLIKSGIFNEKELTEFQTILKDNKDQPNKAKKILDEVKKKFYRKIHKIYLTMNEISPIEKAGIIGTDIETFQRMYKELDNYNSITIDECAKYGNVALHDGTFDFRHLQKTLDFARDNKKQVRLNTLLFYMDCPEELYNLTPTHKNKEKVKRVLKNYVKQITELIQKYNDNKDNKIDGKIPVVRSIDVFNELLNRFSMNGDTPYQYRGDILQDSDVENFDNIKSGWLKFLDIKDICEVIAVARENLPDMDFMYNDDNLIDPNKIEANIKIINKINEYEKRKNITLINSIGTQMHIDDNITKEQIIAMFDSLKQYGLPIEITEFDLAMTSDKIKGISEEEIINIKIEKMKELFDAITECKEKYNIIGFTVWSKTDAQNFRVELVNEQRIEQKQEPITTLHGGFYNNDMTEKKEQQLVKSELQEMLLDQDTTDSKDNQDKHVSSRGYANTITLILIASFALSTLLIIVSKLIK